MSEQTSLPPEDAGPRVPPSYPPKTPPPPKRPVEAPRPQPTTKPVTTRARMSVKNRRVVNWAFARDQWAAGKASKGVLEAVRGWGYVRPADDVLDRAVRVLVDVAAGDGGRRLSVHCADQDAMVLVVAVSHAPGPVPDDVVLGRLASVPGLASCGTDLAEDGRRVWALMDTSPLRRRTTLKESA